MKQLHAINILKVPEGYEETAIEVREEYVAYFRNQPGFIGSTCYRSINKDGKFNFINVVIWDSYESYQAIVNTTATDKNKTLDKS